MLRNAKGFTLIELMVVVVIIGILAAIALPNFLSMQDRAKESEVKSNAHTTQLSVEDFKTSNNGAKPTAQFVAGTAATSVAAALPGNIKNPFNVTLTGASAVRYTNGAAITDCGTGVPAATAGTIGTTEYQFESGTTNAYNIRGCGKSGAVAGVINLTEGF